MLVEGKLDKEMLIDCLPEATSQAIALSEVTGCSISSPLASLITMYLVITVFGGTK